MSPYLDDDFSKAYTTTLYQTKGQIDINVKVKSDENLEVDLLFIGNLKSTAWETEDLGLFDRLMKVHPTIFVEHYSGYLKPEHIIRCSTRRDLYISGEKKEYNKRKELFTEAQKPFTWMLATGCSQEILQLFWARPDEQFGTGVYRIAPGLGIGIVVIRELPETTETIWLRGLGKDKILTQAFANISQLPSTKRERNDIVELCIKHFKYLSEKSSESRLTEEEEDFMKTMAEIDALYKSEMNRARLEGQLEGEIEGRRQVILRLLNRKVGDLSPEWQTRIESLSIDKLTDLGEALLDFQDLHDLIVWFDNI
jgi:hypothetical protein